MFYKEHHDINLRQINISLFLIKSPLRDIETEIKTVIKMKLHLHKELCEENEIQ